MGARGEQALHDEPEGALAGADRDHIAFAQPGQIGERSAGRGALAHENGLAALTRKRGVSQMPGTLEKIAR